MRKITLVLVLSLSLLATRTDFPSRVAAADSTLVNIVRGMRISPVRQVTPTPVPTSSSNGQPVETPARTGPPLGLTLILLAMCLIFLVLIGVVILGFVVRRQNIEAVGNLPPKDSDAK
jgi:hypothetical protein